MRAWSDAITLQNGKRDDGVRFPAGEPDGVGRRFHNYTFMLVARTVICCDSHTRTVGSCLSGSRCDNQTPNRCRLQQHPRERKNGQRGPS